MPKETYFRLCHEIDFIYHCAACVSVHSYLEMKATTLNSIQEILKFACSVKTKALCYISSVGVFMSVSNMNIDTFYEEDSLKHGKGLLGGYTQSKWVTEHIVRIANQRGLPVCIVRPTRIVAMLDSLDKTVPHDNLGRLLTTFIHTKSAPDLSLSMGFIPVDVVSKALCCLTKDPSSFDKTFHFVNPHLVTLKNIVQVLSQLGHPIEIKPYNEWIKVLQAGSNNIGKTLFFSSPVYNQLSYFECMQSFGDNKFSYTNTLQALQGTLIPPFPTSEEIVTAYLKSCINDALKKHESSYE